jgi:hypothetical protein
MFNNQNILVLTFQQPILCNGVLFVKKNLTFECRIQLDEQFFLEITNFAMFCQENGSIFVLNYFDPGMTIHFSKSLKKTFNKIVKRFGSKVSL